MLVVVLDQIKAIILVQILTMMMEVEMVIIQQFPVLLVLIIQFIRKYQKHHSIARIKHIQAIMQMLKHNVKYSIFVH